jgi:hypothetical protein
VSQLPPPRPGASPNPPARRPIPRSFWDRFTVWQIVLIVCGLSFAFAVAVLFAPHFIN